MARHTIQKWYKLKIGDRDDRLIGLKHKITGRDADRCGRETRSLIEKTISLIEKTEINDQE